MQAQCQYSGISTTLCITAPLEWMIHGLHLLLQTLVLQPITFRILHTQRNEFDKYMSKHPQNLYP